MASPTFRGLSPPDTISREGSTIPSTSLHSKTSPEPGDAPSTSTVFVPNSSERAMSGWPAGNALIVKCTRSATYRVSAADSEPWSWAAFRPMPFVISTTLFGASSRNTPTVRISGGSLWMIRSTTCGVTWRGDGANTNPTASAPNATASSASASEVMPQIFTITQPLAIARDGRRGPTR